MKILLDTNVLLWAAYRPEFLSKQALALLQDDSSDIAYSSVSLWEIEIKHLKYPDELTVNAQMMDDLCRRHDLERIDLKPHHIFYLSELKLKKNVSEHKDPFDKILICQAVTENCVFFDT